MTAKEIAQHSSVPHFIRAIAESVCFVVSSYLAPWERNYRHDTACAMAEKYPDFFKFSGYSPLPGACDPKSPNYNLSDPVVHSADDYFNSICAMMYDLVVDWNINPPVSEHFCLREILSSDAAASHNIRNDGFSFYNLVCAVYLIYYALEPIRSHYLKPVYVHSFFRNPELNRVVGGVKNSLHKLGCAADIRLLDINPKTIARFCSDRGISQISYDTFNHIQFKPSL